jgi:F-type H+-transporting ATPase subunit delta
MSDVAVGGRYAQAFLGVAGSPVEGEALARITESVARAYADSPELRSILSNPVVPIAQREAVVSQVVAALGGTDVARRCLLVMLRRGRISALPEAAQALRSLVDEARGVLRGEVITARTMPDTFYADLERNLSVRHGKNVVLERSVDQELVGGVVTHVDGQTIDQSVRGSLARIERELLDSIGKAGALVASSPASP